MLQQISWAAYAATIFFTAVIYYGYVMLTYYRSELTGTFRRLTGKAPLKQQTGGDLLLPELSVLGATRQDGVDHIAHDELLFEPENEETAAGSTVLPIGNVARSALSDTLAEMIGETKMLIRVINESGESQENFELLFRLIIQKYPELTNTPYEDQVNHFLLGEGAEQLPFTLSLSQLKTYWSTEKELQSA
ncbi:hypothetical protein [Mucilaginibacter hurinus]|nr:hypothetical protein [Mucilaginibacter hurinus]